MITSPLAYRIAREQVDRFGDTEPFGPGQQLGHDQDLVVDLLDCQAFLQTGIDAFHWIHRADQSFRTAIYQEGADDASQALGTIDALLTDWLQACGFANRWIDKQGKRGHEPENLAQFRECEAEVRAIVQARQEDELPDGLRDLRDKAIEDHRNGQTSEFL